ncbi:hypothetical protein JCM3765_002321 [Sporobolomyces pararoseus]
MTDYASTALGLSHFAVGASSLISPRFTSSLFLLAYDPTASFITRLFGSRDLILGYSIVASTSSSTTSGLERKRWAIGLANVINGIDVVSALVEWFKSDCTDQGALLGGVGAAALLGLGWWSLKNENTNGGLKRGL